MKCERIALLSITAALAFAIESPESIAIDADPDNAGQVAIRNNIYKAQCAECHKSDLSGEPNWRSRSATGELRPPPFNGTAHTWHHTDALLFETVKEGPGAALPGYNSPLTKSSLDEVGMV